MQSWSSKDFTADRAWGALDIANFPAHRASALDRPTLYLAHQ